MLTNQYFTKKILVTGAQGLLGQHLVALLLQPGYEVVATGKGPSRLPFGKNSTGYSYVEMDFTNPDQVRKVIAATEPDVVVHCGAMTQVDPCELDPDACELVNVTGTRYLLEAIGDHVHFIFLSTDFVFDGLAGPYTESAEPAPLSVYGNSKLSAERLIEEHSMSPWTVVRTVLVYGAPLVGARPNIITWVKDNLEAGKPIKVVSDQWRTPTYVKDLASGVEAVIRMGATGHYHISGKDFMTPYDMALRTAALLGLDDSLITKVDAATFTQPGRRPARTGFIIDKAVRELEYHPVSFEEGILLTLGL